MRNYSTKLTIESILNKQISSAELSSGSQRLDHISRKVVTCSCHICYKQTIKKNARKSENRVICSKPVCDEHAITKTQCKECAE